MEPRYNPEYAIEGASGWDYRWQKGYELVKSLDRFQGSTWNFERILDEDDLWSTSSVVRILHIFTYL